eukprot:TRINITY_DN16674_c1_g1_i1.p1 TRINITY_DN16674_c1_g1~~TRINITY_DN16674_c1_g1_i1.p1  ORF type:complete len:485 (+),score=85.94 TRINITY_DN16674_c1_g1_i1:36-1490(+)
MDFDTDSFEAESPPKGGSYDNSSSGCDDDDDDDDFDLPGMESPPRPAIKGQPMVGSGLQGDSETDSEAEGFRSVPAQPQLKRRPSNSSSCTSSAADEDSGPVEPKIKPAPPIPASEQNWSRQSEFDTLNPETIFYSPLSPESIVVSDFTHGYLFTYRTPLGCLGKLQAEFVGNHKIHIKWHTYNTLIPGAQESYSEGTAVIVLGDELKFCFNLSYGCYGDGDPVGAVKRYGVVSSDVAFLQQTDTDAIIFQAVNGTFLHDYNPNLTGGGVPELVRLCTEDYVSIRWNPPHVLHLSDHSIMSIQKLLGNADELNQPQVDALINTLFGREVMQRLQEWMIESDVDQEGDFEQLLGAGLRFVESGFVSRTVWDLSFRNGGASALILIQLIDALVVNGNLTVVAEFFVCLLFGRKKTVSKADLKYLLRNIIGSDPDLNHQVIDDLFKKGRKATKSDIRYALHFIDGLITATRYFTTIADLITRTLNWD